MKNTQNNRILAHIKRHGSITPLEALNEYGCLRLAARVYELREAGHKIDMERVDWGNKHFARYYMRKSKTQKN